VTASYCKVQDVYDLALTARAFVSRPKQVEAVAISTGILKVTGHALAPADLVTLEVTTGGALPPEYSAAQPYNVAPISSELFQLVPVGGSAITALTDAGKLGSWGIVVDHVRRLQRNIRDASARIDQMLLDHGVPLERDPETGEYPDVIVGICARMAARATVPTLLTENAAFRVAIDRLLAQEGTGKDPEPGTDRYLLAAWFDGAPIRPEPTAASSTPTATARANGRRPVGWLGRRSL
jgi:hypothetical protein